MQRRQFRASVVMASAAVIIATTGVAAHADPGQGLSDQGAVTAASKAAADAAVPGAVGVTAAGVSVPAGGPATVVVTSPRGLVTTLTAPGSAGSRFVGAAAVADADGAKIVSQALAPGVATHTIAIGDPTAPQTYSFDVAGSAEQRPTLRSDGSVALIASDDGVDVQTGSIAKPWAVGADGTPIPTRFDVTGSTVTQTIAPAPTVQYPVVADPRITFGRSVQIMLTGAEANSVRRAAAAVLGVGVKIGCSAPARAAVAAIGGPVGATASAVIGLGCKYGEAALVTKLFDTARQHGPYVDIQCYASELLAAIGGKLAPVSSDSCSG